MATYYLKFRETRKVKQGDGEGAQFDAGRIYPFTSEGSVQHWLKRGAAESVTDADFKEQLRADRAAEQEAAKKAAPPSPPPPPVPGANNTQRQPEPEKP